MRRPQRIEPGPGQESVWDYPRPPRVETTPSRIVVTHAGRTIADTTGAWRVLETSQPPAFYLPPDDVDLSLLEATTTRTFCEWKGLATYWTIRVPGVGDRPGAVSVDAAWSYADPTPGFAPIADHLAFYPQRVDRCTVDGEVVQPNEGGFYGGWVTSKVVGPFKGGAGTAHW